METINQIELKDEHRYPTEEVLQPILGESYPAYCALLNLYERHGLSHEWRYYHDGKAWLCKVQHKKRTIVWMSAWKGYMQATVYVPEKHIDKIYALEISEARNDKIRNTKNTGTSKPCIFEVRDTAVLDDFEKVMQFKIQTK